MDLLQGRIKRQLFEDGDGFRVYRTHAGDAVRTLDRARIPANTSFRASGRWRPYRDSRTFVVASFEELTTSRGKPLRERAASPPRVARVPDATPEGIARWVERSRVPGVGKATAARILEAGEAIVGAMADENAFAFLTGMTPSRAEAICAAWAAARHAEEHARLIGAGVPFAVAARMVRRHGAEAPDVLLADPWHLASTYRGVGFEACDAIATTLGVSPMARERIVAAMARILADEEKKGSTGVTGVVAAGAASRLLGIDRGVLNPLIGDAIRDPSLSLEGRWRDGGGELVRILQGRKSRAREAAIAAALLRRPPMAVGGDLASEVEAAAAARGMRLEPEQAAAARAALGEAVSIVTGGPGTGKSSCMAVVVEAARRRGERVVCMAPTGRAARRLGEATGMPTATVHRTLGRRPGGGGATHDEGNPIPADLVIVDECSMLDCVLAAQLVSAIGPGTRLLLVGDADQLASVGPGNVLGDAIASGAVATTRLARVHRQAEGSGIVRAAHAILAGREPVAAADVALERRVEVDVVVAAVRAICERDGSRPSEVMVLSPTNGKATGTVALNVALKAAFNPTGPAEEATFEGVAFGVGDKVMQTRNDYDRMVFNGEVGTVSAVDANGPSMTVTFPDAVASYEGQEARAIRHAFAVTVHKAQGSEARDVVVVLDPTAWNANRRLVYTAVTRARESLTIVARAATLRGAIARVGDEARVTGLRHALEEGRASRGLPNPF